MITNILLLDVLGSHESFLAPLLAAGDLAPLWSGQSLVALFALTMMEIVLGIDNIVFIAIITGRLPVEKRSSARRFGLFLAMGMRILLLLAIGQLMTLVDPLVLLNDYIPAVFGIGEWLIENHEVNEVSGKDLILLVGGLFLLYTAVREIHHKVEGDEEEHELGNLPGDTGGSTDGITPVTAYTKGITVKSVLIRIALMDVIFSLDSVITAVGMAGHVSIMVAAVIISVGVMIVFANQISDFVQEHPTVKMLALSFLILISVVLLSEAMGQPISKGYVYFAMVFSLSVEFLNLRVNTKRIRPSDGEGEVG